jgi:hypothetical protein
MNILTQNSKMKKSSTKDVAVYNWTIPAYKALDGTITCPNASKCIKGCYAQQGAYVWSNTQKSHNEKLELTRSSDFVNLMVTEIKAKAKKHKSVYIRIHDAGDFYSSEYLTKWLSVMDQCKDLKVKFYAYTKQVEMFKAITVPSNFIVIFSFGGKQDTLINPETDRHAWVFESEQELLDKGYVNASSDDLLALTANNRVGLCYHGTRSYANTTWNKVKGV